MNKFGSCVWKKLKVESWHQFWIWKGQRGLEGAKFVIWATLDQVHGYQIDLEHFGAF